MDGQFRIDSLWAFTVVDDDDTEGIIAQVLPDVGTAPLVGADLARVRSLMPYAQLVATRTGKPVSLVHFSNRTVQEIFQP